MALELPTRDVNIKTHTSTKHDVRAKNKIINQLYISK